MAQIDKQYNELLQRILREGTIKGDRTGTGTLSIFEHTLRYDMSNGFPLLTTKKMFTKGIITELLWFLNGDTSLRGLVEQGNNIWVGDAYKAYLEVMKKTDDKGNLINLRYPDSPYSKEEFIENIKREDVFNENVG